MAKYLVQFAYSDDALAGLVRHPQDRGAVLSALSDRLGGKVESFYHSYGEYDLIIIAEFQNDETMQALQVAIRSTGVSKDLKITPLLTREEAISALKRAGSADYHPPS